MSDALPILSTGALLPHEPNVPGGAWRQPTFRRANPWAERALLERLLEAGERGLWERPDPEALARLRDQHGKNEAWLEGG